MGFLWNFPISRRRRRSCHQRILLKLGRSARDSRRLARRFLQGLNLGFRMVKHTWKPMTYWDLRRFNKVKWGLTKVSQGLAIQKLDLNQEQSGFSQQTSGYLWKSDDFVQHSVWSFHFLSIFWHVSLIHRGPSCHDDDGDDDDDVALNSEQSRKWHCTNKMLSLVGLERSGGVPSSRPFVKQSATNCHGTVAE